MLDRIIINAQKYPEKNAIISKEKVVTYKELIDYISIARNILYSFDLKRGDHIILFAKKEIEVVFFYFASHSVGIENVLLDPDSNENRLNYILSIINPNLIIGREIKNYKTLLYTDLDWNIQNANFNFGSTTDGEDIADILFTTGTTGLPKGVMLSHKNLLSAIDNINGYINNSPDDIELLALPLCHSFGIGRLRCVLSKGGTIILIGGFSNIKLVFDMFEKYHVTGFGMVPSIWAYIKKFSGRRIEKYSNQIKYIEIGSASMSVDSKKELMEIFPNTRICMHFGLTEASRSTFMEFHQDKDFLQSIGKPSSKYVEIAIYDEYGSRQNINQEGEICIKGDMVMKSYYKKEDNENAFWHDYFRTGDCGYIDENGYIFLVGRKKEIINVGGEKVSPIEVEDAVSSLFPEFEDSICVGIKDPSGILGEVVKIYIKSKQHNTSFFSVKKKLEHVLEQYKVPVAYEWIDEIPKTSSGKKQRLALKKEIYEKG